MTSDERALETRLASAIDSMGGLRGDYERENLRREAMDDRRKKMIYSALAGMVAALIVGVWGIRVGSTAGNDASRAEHALAAYQADRASQSIKNCHVANVQTGRAKRAFEDGPDLLVAQAGPHPTPAVRAQIATYLASIRAKAATDFPLRDCSAKVAGKGIVKYLPPTTEGTP